MVFRILATIFLGFSIITSMFKNIVTFRDSNYGTIITIMLYGIAWRAFCIVSVWVI